MLQTWKPSWGYAQLSVQPVNTLLHTGKVQGESFEGAENSSELSHPTPSLLYKNQIWFCFI